MVHSRVSKFSEGGELKISVREVTALFKTSLNSKGRNFPTPHVNLIHIMSEIPNEDHVCPGVCKGRVGGLGRCKGH